MVVPDVAQGPVESGGDEDTSLMQEKESGKSSQGLIVNDPISFGSHGNDEKFKGEAKNVPESNLPDHVVDEWPRPTQIHSFYFVRYRPYDDPTLKTKVDLADKDVQKKNLARSQITEKLKVKRSDRAKVISQLKVLTAEDKQFRLIIDEKRKEMEPLQQALGKLRGNNAGRERGSALCSSEEELDKLIQSLNNRIQHESISLNEEKQIIREINQLQGTREKVISNSAMKAKIQESLGQKEVIQDQVKGMGVDLDGVRKEQQAVKVKIKPLEEELRAIDNDISSLEAELEVVTHNRRTAYENLQGLRQQRDEGNVSFYQNRSLLNKARELASKKDVSSLEEFSHTEMENFMVQWNNNKAIRDDYQRRILGSLDSRELSKDGRIRNPNEKLLVAVEAPSPSETGMVTKATVKQPNEDLKSFSKHDAVSSQKGQKGANNNKVASDSKHTPTPVDKEEEDIPLLEKPHEKDSSAGNEVDAAKLKEMKREEEMGKAKLAMERKKKLAEKAAVKAAVRAKKEAERKLKEREKKAMKKAAASIVPSHVDKPTELAAEIENDSEEAKMPLPQNNRDHQENTTVRSRQRLKGPEPRPRVVLRRKKSTNYWLWAAPISLLAVLLLVFGYQRFH